LQRWRDGGVIREHQAADTNFQAAACTQLRAMVTAFYEDIVRPPAGRL
jgi:hypothetical protein